MINIRKKQVELLKNKLLIISGGSASSKDSVLSRLDTHTPCISHTTRKMRPSEVQGREYHFVDLDTFNSIDFIEQRHYTTIGADGQSEVWHYGLAKSELQDLSKPRVVIVDSEGARELSEYVGHENCLIFYFEVSDEVALKRFHKRGDGNLAEFIRRREADAIDFADFEDKADHIFNTDMPLNLLVEEVKTWYNYHN